MSNKQQTAVEWLYNELFYFLNAKSKFEDSDQILDKAKEMEKEQMIDAYWHVNKDDIHFDDLREEDDGEIWYNETYGGNK
jgi:HEPN domain-containing protein